MNHISNTEEDTIKIAQDLAKEIRENDVIALHGNLGMGKSVFARALIRACTDDPELDVPSPTFTLVQLYDTPKGQIAHFDLYRLEDPEEIFDIGWEDALSTGITIIEWPDRLGPYLPRERVDIHLQAGDNGNLTRKILIERVS